MSLIPPPPPTPNTGLLGLGRVKVLQIHAFHSAAFWLSLLTPFFFAPIVFMLTGSLSSTLAAAGGSLAFAVLLSGTVTDLMSMRIPNPLTALSFLPAFLWWSAIALGFEAPTPVGFGRDFYAPILVGMESGSLVPEVWTGTLFKDIVMSFAGMILVFIPLLLSFIFGAMGGGDAKFMPPLALFFGWSLGFDFLFLTFLFGGLFAIPMILLRTVCRFMAQREGAHKEVIRIARMKTFAYAPAIAVAGIICLAAKWQGIIG
jgi:Flp pilus assembly protein protease CpaA